MAMDDRALTIHCEGPSTATLLKTHDAALDRGMVRIHVASLDALAERGSSYHALLDQGEADRLARFRFEEDRQRFLLGHGLLREILGQALRTDPAAIVFQRGRFGKPFVANSTVRFNLSDTKDAVAVALTLDTDLGLDLETMTRHVDHRSVSQHYFTPGEQDSIAAAVDGKRRFLELWTRKEAVLKASGVGIMDDLRSLRVDQVTNDLRIRHPEFVAMSGPEYHVHTWHVGDALLLSLATPHPVDRVEIVQV